MKRVELKRNLVLIVFLILNIVLFNVYFVRAEIRINEVELNPPGSSDDRNEWIEVYSDSSIDMTNWVISSNNGRNVTFNASFSDYYTFNTSANLLTDTNNILFLKNDNNEIVATTLNLSDNYNDRRTWQYCDSNWIFSEATIGAENNCSSLSQSCIQNWNCSSWGNCSANQQTRTCTDTNNCGNSTGKPAETQSCTNNSENSEISLDMTWVDEEIINGDEFEIELSVKNLEDKNYAVKVWIESDSKIISERYGNYSNDGEVWKDGNYYVYNFFSGSGDKTKDVRIRIKEEYRNFSGDAKIFFRLKNISEIEMESDIEILEEDNQVTEEEITNSSEDYESSVALTEEVIKLGDSKNTEEANVSEKNSIVYKSRNEYIKEYAIYGFSILCVAIIALLLIDKKNR